MNGETETERNRKTDRPKQKDERQTSRFIYKETLTHEATILEAEFHSLLSASSRPRKASDAAWRPKSWGADGADSILGLKSWEQAMLRAGQGQGWSPISQAVSLFNLPLPCSIQTLSGLSKAHPLWEGHPAGFCSPIHVLVFSGNTFTHTPSYPGIPWPRQVGMESAITPCKLSIPQHRARISY